MQRQIILVGGVQILVEEQEGGVNKLIVGVYGASQIVKIKLCILKSEEIVHGIPLVQVGDGVKQRVVGVFKKQIQLIVKIVLLTV